MTDDQRSASPAADDTSAATGSDLAASPSAPPSAGLPNWLLIGVAVGLLVVLTLVGLYVLRLGPFEPTTGERPSPTPSAVASSPPPTDQPPTDGPPAVSPSITPPPAPTPTPDTTAVGALLSHVPADIRESCQPSTGLDGARALLSCPTSDGRFTLSYAQYADEQALTQIYEATFRTSEIDRDSGDCGDASTWPAEASYAIEGQPNGRYLCMFIEDVPAIYWTDTPLVIFAWMTAEPGDERALYEFWRTAAGPLP